MMLRAATPLLLLSGSTISRAFNLSSRSTIRPLQLQSTLLQSSMGYHPRNHRSKLAMMASTSTGNLVTIQQAIDAHKASSNNVKFIDGSWHMPVGDKPRNGRSEYISGPRIKGAYYFDIDDISPPPGTATNPNGLPHMKPTFDTFARTMDAMNISPNDTLYVYATNGCGFYHRSYWTLRGYHDPSKVKLLQGSLEEWKENGGELEYEKLNEEDEDSPRLFCVKELDTSKTPKYTCWKDDGEEGSSLVVNMDQVLEVVKQETSDTIIVDARSAGRFYGKDPEPRPGLRGGHMPGAINVPFMSLLDSNDLTKFKPMEEVRDIFIGAGIKPLDEGENSSVATKVICSCGSGVTAAALAVGLEECGLRRKEDISIYDGSWIDWGGNDDTPIVTD